ncbi:MAG: EF-P lysine aminoacylase EpmA [Wenzhouxiangella sp.]|nr:EF-P lysine aminoacylase EpmA [Wenzhouxiangella sp.]
MRDWRPSASIERLRSRAEITARIRHFMRKRNTLEVSTPVITTAGVTEPQIESMMLESQAGYLRTSPEYHHKRLLAAHAGDVYEIGPVFRDGEKGRLHRPEFTLVEWYRVDKTWQDLASETLELIKTCTPVDARHWEIRWVGWSELFQECLGFDPLSEPERALTLTESQLPESCDLGQRLDFLFSLEIQARFPQTQLTVVSGYPATQAALARLDPHDSRLACRFEVFAGPLELANGYEELTDPIEQRLRFERDNERRRLLNRPVMPLDEDLLAAMAHGLPPCSGVALGLERLLMAIFGLDSIDQAMAFS